MAAQISSSSVLNRDNVPGFVLHVDEMQPKRGIICRFVQSLFESRCGRVPPVHVHTWHINRIEYPIDNCTINLFKSRLHRLTFTIIGRNREILNQGLIPIQNSLNVQQMILFLKKCEISIEGAFSGDKYAYYPVFFSKPVHIWIRQGFEIRLLYNRNELIAQVLDSDCRYQTRVRQILNTSEVPERINYLVNRCIPRLEDSKKVSFYEIKHQWKWKSTLEKLKDPYEVSLLLSDSGALFWHIINLNSRYEEWRKFESRKEEDGLLDGLLRIFSKRPPKPKEDLYNFNCDCWDYEYREMMREDRKRDDLINLMKDFRVHLVQEGPLRIHMGPFTHLSQIDINKSVSKFYFAVSITVGPKGIGGNHTKIVVEGIKGEEDFEPEQGHNIRPGDYFMHVSHLTGPNSIETGYRTNQTTKLKFDTRSKVWICSAKKVSAMIKRIHQEQRGPGPVHFSLSSGLKSDEKGVLRYTDNCFTWARRTVGYDLGVRPEELSFFEKSLSTSIISLFATPGKAFTYTNSQHYNRDVAESIRRSNEKTTYRTLDFPDDE